MDTFFYLIVGLKKKRKKKKSDNAVEFEAFPLLVLLVALFLLMICAVLFAGEKSDRWRHFNNFS